MSLVGCRSLKFKPQSTVYIFSCCQSSKQTSQKTEVHFSRVKRSRLSVVIFQSILFVSVFQGSLVVAIILIDGSQKHNGSWVLNFRVCMLLEVA